MILYITILYFIFFNLNSIYITKNSKLYFTSGFQFIKSFFVLFGFIGYFVVFVRLMNFFRDKKILDLKYYIFEFDLKLLILCIVFLYFMRKNLFLKVKINCYRLHYYFMNNLIESNKLKPYYNQFFNEKFSFFIYYSYPFLYYVNIVLTTITYNLVIFDLLFNDLILNNSTYIIPLYSFFKFVYNFICYFECKHHALFEYLVRNHNYMLYLKSKNIINKFEYDIDAAENSYLKYEKEVIREL